MADVAHVSDQRVKPLDEHWEFARADPDSPTSPEDLSGNNLEWRPASLPTTVARALGLGGEAGANHQDLEEFDFWFRRRFVAPAGEWSLRFNGLATLADVWLDGEHVVSADNMFVTYGHSARAQRAREIELAVRFRALRPALRERRGRARWRTRLVDDSALRHARTTLFGRMPGWTPLIPAIGPWRSIELVEHGALDVAHADVRARANGSRGIVSANLVVRTASGVRSATLVVGAVRSALTIAAGEGGTTALTGEVELPHVERWWPHTHGPQPLYPVALSVELDDRRVELDLGITGFRTLELARENGGFALIVNDAAIFCRGACWLPLDPLALDAPDHELEQTLRRARAAGMNMLRVAAQGIYERTAFFRRCTELGILVWQDFMFSRMDYPCDAAFSSSVEREASQFLDRTQLSPALAVLCGNSEVEQQVAMAGLDPELGRLPLFHRMLPELTATWRPDVPYWPSTPSGGALPFHVDAGVAHYFGVGAYRRSFSDARLSNVRFSAECLAFSNVPDRSLVEHLLGRDAPGATPRWKLGIMRDSGASWDFEDVRDHYLEACFDVDARELRTSDPERWLELGRVATGEAMTRTIAQFRRADSSCSGALIWHLRDFVPGAGCGLLDVCGNPKAAYWFVARACQPVSLFLNDEGLNGLRARAINDTSRSLALELTVSLYRNGGVRVDRATVPIALPPRSAAELSIESLLGHFVDPTHAYRFGPPNHDVVAARLIDTNSGELLASALHFPLGLPSTRRADLAIDAVATAHPLGFAVHLRSNVVAYAVHVEAKGFEQQDDYFHLEPDHERILVLADRNSAHRPVLARITALNAFGAIAVRLEPARAVASA